MKIKETREYKNIKVKGCDRCGETHDIKFMKFRGSAIDRFNYWGICKNTNDPVLLKFMDIDYVKKWLNQ